MGWVNKMFRGYIMSEYYKIISKYLYNEYQYENFNDNEIHKIKTVANIKKLVFKYSANREVSLILHNTSWSPKRFLFDIRKSKDDWYYISYHNKDLRGSIKDIYYKCDQFDGLLKLIDELL